MTDSPVMIDVADLVKNYGERCAVDHITFQVRKGEVLGFLGPNGAGKTTTMKILTCFLSPTSGAVQVAGNDVIEDSLEVRRKIGYLPEDTPIYRDMTVLEYLLFVTEMRGLGAQPDRLKKIKEIVDLCGISDRLGSLVGELSKGLRQRVGLAQAMVHDPEILILDEPTTGLDPNQIVEIRSLIKRIGREKTVILSTHILPEVQATCGRVVIISDGRLVADGTPEELQERQSGHEYTVVFDGAKAGDGESVRAGDVRAHLESMKGAEKVTPVDSDRGSLAFRITSPASMDLRAELFRFAVDRKLTLLELGRRTANLEDIFRKLTSPADGAARKAEQAARSQANGPMNEPPSAPPAASPTASSATSATSAGTSATG